MLLLTPTSGPISTPPIAASMLLNAYDSPTIRLTLIPTASEASRSNAVARSARPIIVEP